MPSGLILSWLILGWLILSGLIPSGLIPSWLIPSGLIPSSLIPSGCRQGGMKRACNSGLPKRVIRPQYPVKKVFPRPICVDRARSTARRTRSRCADSWKPLGVVSRLRKLLGCEKPLMRMRPVIGAVPPSLGGRKGGSLLLGSP